MNTWSERFGGAALITGASSGIGEAFAQALAARGMDLILVARGREQLEALARALETEHKVRAVVVAVDLAHANVAQIVRAEAEAVGLSVGLLVNNAGFGLFGHFVEQDPTALADMIDVNCRAPVALARVFAPDMVAKGRGGIIPSHLVGLWHCLRTLGRPHDCAHIAPSSAGAWVTGDDGFRQEIVLVEAIDAEVVRAFTP
jgi:short-subunit dehydrogenase